MGEGGVKSHPPLCSATPPVQCHHTHASLSCTSLTLNCWKDVSLLSTINSAGSPGWISSYLRSVAQCG